MIVNIIIQTASLIILLFITVFGLIPTQYTDAFFILQILLLDLLSTISFFFVRGEKFKELNKNYLRFSYIFIFSLIIVHFQAFIDLLIGNHDPFNDSFWINKDIIYYVLIVASIALISYYLGYSVLNKVDIKSSYKGINNKTDLKIVKVINIILLVLFISQINRSFLNPKLYSSNIERLDSLGGLFMLLYETSFIAITVLITRNNIYSKKIASSIYSYLKAYSISFIGLLIYIIIIILSGDRGPIIYLTLSLISGFVLSYNYKVKLPYLILLVLIAVFSFTVLGIIRGSTYDDKGIPNIVEYQSESRLYPKSFAPLTKELAGSALTLQVAVNEVPKNSKHTNGVFLLQNTSLLIPGLNSTVNDLLETPQMYRSSPKFLTYIYFDGKPRWGVGSSSVADTYLDFGITGLLVVFFLFGYLSRRIELNIFVARNVEVMSLSIFILFFSFSVYITRSNLVVPFTKLPYVIFFCYIPVFISKLKNNY